MYNINMKAAGPSTNKHPYSVFEQKILVQNKSHVILAYLAIVAI